MDKSDLDFLVQSQDIYLLYKHILKAIQDTNEKLHAGVDNYTFKGEYTISHLALYALNNRILYTDDAILIGRIDKYVEL